MLCERAQQLAWTIAARNTADFWQCRSQVGHLFQGSRAIADSAVLQTVEHVLAKTRVPDTAALPEFKQIATPWLVSHGTNRVTGLDQFCVNFSAGTTQAFDHFYLSHRHRRFRCLVGEYFYHVRSWISHEFSWSWITDVDSLQPGDAMVVSVPFCDTGSAPQQLEELLEQCDLMDIPVLLDCCYWGISSGINLNLDHPCIDTVTFGLSKSFPVAGLRIGMRYVRPGHSDGQQIYDRINYNNQVSARVGVGIMQQFACDHTVNQYIRQQQEICEYLDITASQSVLFAVGDASWNQYNRALLLQDFDLDFDPAMFVNRICLVPLLENWDAFEQVRYEN